MKISTAYLSEQGGREKNDDTIYAIRDTNSICVFVGDGLGGYEDGKIASKTAGETILSYRNQYGFQNDENMLRAVEAADYAVKEQQMLRGSNMKTTVVVLEVNGRKARWMHVGDSRLYQFTEGKISHQTMDHSVSQVSVLMGEITPDEIRFHEDRNRVLRALGSENAKPDISPVTEIKRNTVFLLCTDGFWEYVYEKEMEETLAESESPKEWLMKMCRLMEERVPDGHDNYTAAAVFCRIDD